MGQPSQFSRVVCFKDAHAITFAYRHKYADLRTSPAKHARRGVSIARVLTSLGDLSQARELGDQVLNRRRRLLGDDHPDTLTAASQLGTAMLQLGEYRQARQLMNDTL